MSSSDIPRLSSLHLLRFAYRGTTFVLRIIDRAEFFRLPRFRCIIQFAGGIFIRIVLCPRVERVGGGEGEGGGNLFPGGKSFVVRITGLRVEKSVAQRVVQASTRHIPSRGRLARHRKRFWPKTAPRIPTSSAPVIGPDRENKDSHGHNRGSTSGYGPVPYSYEHSATPAPPIYPALYPTSLYSTYSYRETVSNFRSIISKISGQVG